MFCTGLELCDPINDCLPSSGDPCVSPLLCDEGNDLCVECLDDTDCDDSIDCTDDSCIAGVCSNLPNDLICNDGTICTLDVCDPINSQNPDGCINTLDLDADNDGVCDLFDNCPDDANPGQEDADGDGVGDACDNCPDVFNPDQDPDACICDDTITNCSDDVDCGGTDPRCSLSFDAGFADCQSILDALVLSDFVDVCLAAGLNATSGVCIDVEAGVSVLPTVHCEGGLVDVDACVASEALLETTLVAFGADISIDFFDADATGTCQNDGNCCCATDPTDSDNDGIADECDNCPNAFNPDQTDTDSDGAGDACDCEPDAVCGDDVDRLRLHLNRRQQPL